LVFTIIPSTVKKRMKSKLTELSDFKFHPVTPKRWDDLVDLFGPRGACAGCWCMWWRIPRSQWTKQQYAGNKRAMKKIVDSGEIPGVLAYADGKPIGWCSVAPRETFPVLERSDILKKVDEKPVWSVVCFFINRSYRKSGIAIELLKAAIEYAKKHKAKIIEGYPAEPKEGRKLGIIAFTGISSTFHKAGFKEVLRRSETRPIMRYFIKS